MGFDVGRHIVIYEKGNIYKNHGYGEVIGEYTTYKLLSDGGTTCTVVDESLTCSSYSHYYEDLFYAANRYQESIDIYEEVLKKILGENFSKAIEIANSCGDRLEPFKQGDSVIIFPVAEGRIFDVLAYKRGTVTEVEFPEVYKSERYYLDRGFSGPFCIPVYRVSTEEGVECVTGNDWNFSNEFIGTESEFVRFLVSNIESCLNILQTIECIREELYSEVKDDPNEDTRIMRHPIEMRDPFDTQKSK